MKVLFPTDFSNAAENAYLYALKLADRFGASINVIHVYEVLRFHTWIEESMNTQEVNDKITLGEFERFKDQIEVLKRIALEHQLADISVHYTLKESDYVVDAIITEAEATEVDLIVIGTTGASGLKELFFGSVASKVMEQAPCPVFVVPETATYRGIQKIGLTLEYKSGELELIERSLAFARLLGAHLHCLHVDIFDPDKVKVRLVEYKDGFKDEPDISFHTEYGLDVESRILEFMKSGFIDVVMMQVHQRSLFQELFSYSIAKRVAYHSDIPLIAIQVTEKV